MRKFLLMILIGLFFACPAHTESESYRQWYDQWQSVGYEAGGKADKYDPDAAYQEHETMTIKPKVRELQAMVEHEKAEEYSNAAKKGFYEGYRSGYYREKEGEIVELIEAKFRDIKITDFKFGEMDGSEKFTVTEETRYLKVPTAEGKENYFGYICNYSENYTSDILTVILTLPGKPGKDIPDFNPSTNSIISKYKIKQGSGHFGNKWYFSKGDLTGTFQLSIYIGDKLVERISFRAAEE